MDQFLENRISRSVRAAIHVLLVIVSASGAAGQRRGAFVAGPPYAGRPPVAAVPGTPGVASWNPGLPSSPTCCFGPQPNGRWHGRSHDRNGSPEILAIPVPMVVGSEPDSQAIPPEDELLATPQPDPRAQPITVVLQSAAPATASGNTGHTLAEAPAQHCAEPPRSEPPHVLIALNNGWVYAATAYWVDRDTLHYVTTGGEHNQVSLSLIDRKISERLNRASQMAFILP